jgi:hypothetical protein
LVIALGDPEEDVAGKAEAGLVKIGPSAEGYLVRALRDHRQPVRVFRILGRVGIASNDALAAVSGFLTDPDLDLRKEASLALSVFGPSASRVLPQLLTLLANAVGLTGRQPPPEWGFKSDHTVTQAFELVAAATTALGRIGPSDTAKPILAEVLDSIKKALALCPANVWNQHSAGRLDPPQQYLAAEKAREAAERALAGLLAPEVG